MTIQFKRGLKRDLPNPLPIGELGYCTDTDEIFRGNGVVNQNKLVWSAPITAATTYYHTTAALGGSAASSGATGESLGASTATGTTANRLIDSTFPGGFTTAKHLNKTVFNVTNGTWAKITAVNSTSNCTLSADIMMSGEDYVICDAFDNLQDAYSKIPTPYYANFSIRCSPGTLAGDAILIGKIAGGNYSITIQTDNTAGAGGTTFSGIITVYDKITFAGGANYKCKFTNRINLRGTADVTWSYCQTSGSSGKVFRYDNSINTFLNSIATFGNDPGTYTETSSTITKGYYILVNNTGGVGSDANAEACALHSGTATSTTANKLVDSNANFPTSLPANMTIFNATDKTWAYVTARDSPTQLSLSADIMVSGESYYAGAAFATVQKAIDTVPGNYNCTTSIASNDGTFSETVTVRGKNPAGNYTLSLYGAKLTDVLTSQTATSGAARTITKTGAGRTVDVDKYCFITIDSGAGAGQEQLIIGNTADTWTISGDWTTNPDSTSVFSIRKPSTIITLVNCFSNFNIYDIKTQRFLGSGGATSILAQRCQFYGTTSRSLYITNGAALSNGTLIAVYGSTGYGCLVDGGGKILVVRRSAFMDNAWNGIHLATGGSALIDSAVGGGVAIINNGDGVGEAIYRSGITVRGNAILYVSTSTYKIYIENNDGYGIYAVTGGIGERASACTYSGNALGTYAAGDAVSLVN